MGKLVTSEHKFILDVIGQFGEERGLEIQESVGIETDSDDDFGSTIKNVLSAVQKCRLVEGVYELICDVVDLDRSATTVAKSIAENNQVSKAVKKFIVEFLGNEGIDVAVV